MNIFKTSHRFSYHIICSIILFHIINIGGVESACAQNYSVDIEADFRTHDPDEELAVSKFIRVTVGGAEYGVEQQTVETFEKALVQLFSSRKVQGFRYIRSYDHGEREYCVEFFYNSYFEKPGDLLAKKETLVANLRTVTSELELVFGDHYISLEDFVSSRYDSNCYGISVK